MQQRATRTKTTEANRQMSTRTSVKPPLATHTPVHPILQLQRAIGNQAVLQLLRSGMIQPKLTISQPGDVYEQEADRIADEVMRMAEPTLQRACASCSAGGTPCPKCEDEKKVLVQRKTEQATDTSTTSVSDDFLHDLGPGQPLEPSTRAFMESRFGHDFSQVRVHAGPRAAPSARALNARAFTLGSDIVLGARESVAPNKLLAHELAHIVQQARAPELWRRVLRTPVISACDATESRNIVRAQAQAINWLARALARLRRPDEIAPELAFHFYATPTERRTLDAIQRELSGVLAELRAESISYHCTPDTDPGCETGQVSGYAYLGSHDASFCGDLSANGGDYLTQILIHEAVHAKAAGVPDGPYRSDPDYPGITPLDNTDAYTNFVKDVATDLIAGVTPLPVEESLGNLPGDYYTSSLSAWDLQTNLHGFPANDATLTAEAQEYLETFLENWADSLGDETVVLRIAGHTDGGSATERENTLGQYRAEAVRDYLTERLAAWSLTAPVDIVVVSFGPSRPFTHSRTARGRALNRRVQIEVRRLTPRRNP